MRTMFLFIGFFVLILLLSGCTSNGNSKNSPTIVAYYPNEDFSPSTGKPERYLSPEPDDSGYVSHYYVVKDVLCADNSFPELVTFFWNNPSSEDAYIAGSISTPSAHYVARADAIFNASVRVDYVCDGRSETVEISSCRKEMPFFFAENGILYNEELRIGCPGDYAPYVIGNKTVIEKGIPLGVDSGDGWIVTSYSIEVAEPYDYSVVGCAGYNEHWLHTYLRESVNGSVCRVGECRGTWHTFECPADNVQHVRKEVYVEKDCSSVSQQKDFRQPIYWYNSTNEPEFITPPNKP